jgi:hypothetical protein
MIAGEWDDRLGIDAQVRRNQHVFALREALVAGFGGASGKVLPA